MDISCEKREGKMSIINKESKTPLYVQLMNILINKIDNYMEENEQLESERDICVKYGVSRTTVRQALDELEKNKYIYKIQGKGNFVASRVVEQHLTKVSSFTQDMKKAGKTPTSKLLNFEIQEADYSISKKLKIEEKELVFKMVRLRLADEIPMIYEITYLPYERFKELNEKIIQEIPLYEAFEKKFNIKITSAEEGIESVLTSKLESVYLGVDVGSPALKFKRITYENKNIIEYTITIARGDKYKYRVTLTN